MPLTTRLRPTVGGSVRAAALKISFPEVRAMRRTRLLFSKTGRARYISHLDLMRTFQRVFLRAGIRLRHTEGFNPHPYMVFALPLPVGCESDCELLDFDLPTKLIWTTCRSF